MNRWVRTEPFRNGSKKRPNQTPAGRRRERVGLAKRRPGRPSPVPGRHTSAALSRRGGPQRALIQRSERLQSSWVPHAIRGLVRRPDSMARAASLSSQCRTVHTCKDRSLLLKANGSSSRSHGPACDRQTSTIVVKAAQSRWQFSSGASTKETI